ncbi:MAG: ABC transporter substrate-binding protein [Oscillospiraceae bacterium]|jgi:putative aldouronate transport system substrate-binding protein|nr:ABC transporter substrate-binding protein [Oscillospiraceae bacterium]
MTKPACGLCVLLAASMLLAGFGGMASAEQPKQVTLEFLAPSPVSQVNDMDAVLAKVYEQTDPTLNVRINYTFTTFDDIGQKASLKMSSGEPLDFVFVAQWTTPSLAQMVSKGLLVNLDTYIESGEYPGLARYFSGDLRGNNAVTDASGETHLYALPFTNAYSGGGAIYYRKDLADKYGIEIKDYDSLTAFFDQILENEPGMAPFSFLGSNDSINGTITDLYRADPITSQHNSVMVSDVSIVIGEDGKAYASRQVFPELDPEYWSRLPDYRKAEDPLLSYKLAREWYVKGYLENDLLSQKDYEGQFMSGRAASFPRAADTYMDTVSRLKAAIPDAELGLFMTELGIRHGVDKASGSDFRAWNFGAIPTTSKNIDRVVGFLNWIFEDPANHDLLELGVEGKHWVAVGEHQYAYPEGVDLNQNYNFYGYVLTWNPLLARDHADTPAFISEIYQKMRDPNFYYKRVDAGFTFVTDAIKTEVAKINDLKSMKRAVENGVVEDFEGEMSKIQAQYEAAGYWIVVEEMERQFNEFLLANPYAGQ